MRTIFNYGYGWDLDEIKNRNSPWTEWFWTDSGRLSGNRFDPAVHFNLYFEASMLAEIDGLAPVLRGAQDVGFACLPMLRNAAETFNGDFKGRRRPTFTPFVDTAALGDIVSLPGHPIAFDFLNDAHLELIWTGLLRPFFEVFDDSSDRLRLERTPSGRILVTWWGLGLGVISQGMMNWLHAQRLLDHVSRRMDEDGYGVPDHIVDTSWPQGINAFGVHGWFNPPSKWWTAHTYRGVTTGVAVPGFHDHAGSAMSRIVPRRNGAVLREALAGMRAAKADYVFLESLTNIEESAGFYRSDNWTPNTLYLDLVREHVQLTRPPAPPAPATVIFAQHVVKDTETKAPIPDAGVILSGGLGEGVTNQDGYKAFNVPPGMLQFSVHHDQYRDFVSDALEIRQNTQVEVVLEAKVAGLFPSEAGPLSRVGTHFETADGVPWQWRNFSLFLAYYRFLRGEDITPDLRWCRAFGYNVVRVFGPLDWDELTDYHHGAFNIHRLADFFGLLASYGLRCEFVPICYPYALAEQRRILQGFYDVARAFPLLFCEGVNEPRRKIDGKIKADCVELFHGINRYGVLTAYGDYPLEGESYRSVPLLDFGTVHLPRVATWDRKARIAQEMQHTTGRPWMSDEPKKAIEQGFVYAGGTRSVSESVHHHGICALFTPGSCVHTEEGKWGRTPTAATPVQLAICEGVRDHVFKKIGPEWQLGTYTGSDSHRTPVNFEYNIWAYASILGNRAMSVRVDDKPSTGVYGWRITSQWGPSNSLADLER